MKKLIYILIFSLFIFNCSDDDNPSTTSITFLEKYEGTVWFNDENDVPSYIRFINNLSTPLENWIDVAVCYQYYLNEFYEGDSITKNSNDILEFRYVESDGGDEWVDIMTLTASENSIEVEYKYYENGDLYESGFIYFTKSSADVESFTLCD